MRGRLETHNNGFRNEFKTQALLINNRYELHNLRQSKGSIGEFARKIIAKTKVAFQAEDKNIPRKLVIEFFIKEPEIPRIPVVLRIRTILNL